jgi:hypothetical protein
MARGPRLQQAAPATARPLFFVGGGLFLGYACFMAWRWQCLLAQLGRNASAATSFVDAHQEWRADACGRGRSP